MQEIVDAQRRRLIEIGIEIASIVPVLSGKVNASEEEMNRARHRLNTFTEESSLRRSEPMLKLTVI